MLQKITELWPSLLRQAHEDPSELEEPLLQSENEHLEELGSQQIDEDQLLIDYKNLYWTRLIPINPYESEVVRKWPLGPDIVEECSAVDGLHEVDPS